MNIVVIFAGGTGRRMHSGDLPKQFLLVHGKPIIVHTIDVFETHPEIDRIVVVCHKDWISHMEDLAWRYRLEKIAAIVPGGETGQMSIYNGLEAADKIAQDNADAGAIVLIHDGVRPLITPQEISGNIASVRAHGSAVTCAKTTETFVLAEDNQRVGEVIDRSRSYVAKAPQSFYLNDILAAERRAISDGFTDVIDSCTLMRMYGHELYFIEGSGENIKITTPEDFYIFRAIYDARENRQLKNNNDLI